MPKIKSHSGAKKRFKVTAKGKVMAKKRWGSISSLKSRERTNEVRKTSMHLTTQMRS